MGSLRRLGRFCAALIGSEKSGKVEGLSWSRASRKGKGRCSTHFGAMRRRGDDGVGRSRANDSRRRRAGSGRGLKEILEKGIFRGAGGGDGFEGWSSTVSGEATRDVGEDGTG